MYRYNSDRKTEDDNILHHSTAKRAVQPTAQRCSEWEPLRAVESATAAATGATVRAATEATTTTKPATKTTGLRGVKLRKDVRKVHAAHATAHAHARLVVLAEVVPLSALRVRQYLVSFDDELELLFVSTLS
jgi:hypothetical protein